MNQPLSMERPAARLVAVLERRSSCSVRDLGYHRCYDATLRGMFERAGMRPRSTAGNIRNHPDLRWVIGITTLAWIVRQKRATA